MELTDQQVKGKFVDLITEGRKMFQRLEAEHEQTMTPYTFPLNCRFEGWRVEAENLILRVCGEDSVHNRRFKELAKEKGQRLSHALMNDLVHTLEGACNDLEGGFLNDVRSLIRADLLDDFLGQAEELLAGGYHIAAISLGGAVLEDTLRKMCDKRALAYPTKTTINVLNVELAKTGAYDKLIQKEILAKSQLRNDADHGNFTQVKSDDAEDMLRWLRRFLRDYLK
jgi:hypothetical protein